MVFRSLKFTAIHIHSNNGIGSEYIIIEKMANSRVLSNIWYDTSENKQIKLLEEIVKIEEKIFGIELAASSSIYYSRDLQSIYPGFIFLHMCLKSNLALAPILLVV